MEETGPDLYPSSWYKEIEPDGKLSLECEIVAIKHKNNVDIVNSTVGPDKLCNSTFKSVDCSVGSVFTLPQADEKSVNT